MADTTERTPLLINTKNEVRLETDILKSPVEEREFSFKSVSRRKKFILVSMALVNFCASCCFSLLAPFFPVEAARKGVSQTVTGLIFGAFELVIFLSSPIFGNYITKIGCKFMFVSGVMVCGTCAILFGLLDKCPDGMVFIAMCFACRCIEALGASAYVTSLFAIFAHEFPDNVITVMGLLETFSGLGMMVGPPIGGALYELGGFGLPFFVIGATVIIIGTFTSFLMPPIPSGAKLYSGSLLTLLRSPLVVVTLINIVAGSFSLGFLDPTLANHLAQFDLKTAVVGLIFLIAPAVYAISAPIWGAIGDKRGFVRLMIGLGSLLSVIPIMMLGPTPFVNSFIPNKLYVNIIALGLMGLFVGCALMPTFKALIMGANSLGLPNNLDTYGKASGFFNSAFALGGFLGPTIGGTMVDKFGFEWATAGIAGIFTFAGGLMLVYMCLSKDLPPISEEEINSATQQTTEVKVTNQSTERTDYAHNENV